MRILVTGGAGYIGSATVRLLAARGHLPVVLDSLERGSRAAVESAPLIVGDVRDTDLVRRALRETAPDAVIHFAGLKSVAESVRFPARYLAANVAGTASLLEAMEAEGADALIFSSTCAIYGTPERLPVDEAAAIRPENPYGESKALAERSICAAAGAGPLRAVMLRYFNAAGASADGRHGEDPATAENLIPLAIAALLGRRPPLTVHGTDYPSPDGTAIRDYIHVDDLAEAHVAALGLLAAGAATTALNVGTGRGITVREILDRLASFAGRPVPADDGPRRAGDPPAVWADTTTAERVLGWRAKRDLDAIIGSAWAHAAASGSAVPATDSAAPR